MSEIYNQLGDAASIILIGLALILRDDFKPLAWSVGIPGALYTLRWIALDNTANAITAAFLTSAAVTVAVWAGYEPKTEAAR
ncbi:hypothetical protein ACFYXD_35205 [Streptomyces platensis]|uniref:hypothetical protein n=1 Tax=Streptomyces platensis TaxID=58346 RepID=UPI0036BF8A3C